MGDQVAATKYINNVEIYPLETKDYIKRAKIAEDLADYAVVEPYAKPHKI